MRLLYPIILDHFGLSCRQLIKRKRLGVTTNVTESLSSACAVEQMSPIKMQPAQEDSTETDRENSVAGCSDDKVHVLLPTEGGKASPSLDPDISDVLFGLCPEDLSFSFHTSHDQTLSPSLLAEPRTCSESDLLNVTAGLSSEDMQVTPGTFFGLPMKVKECLKEYRKIDQLYGKCLQNVV